MERVYLDFNATTPLNSEVKSVLIDELNRFANGSSMLEDGRRIAASMEEARSRVAALIGADPREVIFTSGGSESNNTVFHTMTSDALRRTEKAQTRFAGRSALFVSAVEHPCVLESARYAASFSGLNLTELPVSPDGIVTPESLEKALTQSAAKPLLVSIMMANNEIGTIQDIKALAAVAHAYGALFHTDAVQACGKIPVDVRDLDVDYLTVSAHKIYGPKGVGALYIRTGAPFDSLIKGGHQEHGLRAGTYNSPSIIAFGKAASVVASELEEYRTRTGELRKLLKDGLIASVPDIHINGHPEHVLPNTLNVSFPGAEGEAILLMLDLAGISISTGSACASGSLEPSHVLMATGVGPELAHGSIRFSIGSTTTAKEIEYVLSTVPPIIERLRGFSTVNSKE